MAFEKQLVDNSEEKGKGEEVIFPSRPTLFCCSRCVSVPIERPMATCRRLLAAWRQRAYRYTYSEAYCTHSDDSQPRGSAKCERSQTLARRLSWNFACTDDSYPSGYRKANKIATVQRKRAKVVLVYRFERCRYVYLTPRGSTSSSASRAA